MSLFFRETYLFVKLQCVIDATNVFLMDRASPLVH